MKFNTNALKQGAIGHKLRNRAEKWKEKASGGGPFVKLPRKKKALLLVVAAVILLIVCKLLGGGRAQASAVAYITEEAQKRDITESISGSGTLEPADSYTITTLVEGDILTADFEVGDQVEKDEILYEIDSSNASTSIEQAQISLSESQRSYQRKLENLEDLKVKSPVKGTVTELTVEVGDEVNAGQTLATVKDDSIMKLKLPFPAGDAESFRSGQGAEVTLYGSYETLNGTVTEVSGATTVLSGNVPVKYVTIEVENPGALSDSQMATAEIGSSGSSSGGTFTYKESRTITAAVGGTVTSIPTHEGDTVQKNQVMIVMESGDVEDSVESAANQVRNSQLSLENKQDTLDSYTVTSPIQGTVIEKLYKAGDTIESGKSLCTIYDLSYLTVTLNVDELDISSIEEGQKVTITADAVEGNTYEGEVTGVNMKGTTTNGVTTYPVEIRIDKTEGLLPGMNVTTEILIQNAEDVVTVPVAAVQKGNRILVEGGEEKAEGEDIPNGYGYRTVTVGVSDSDYIEITEGLEAGEKIAYIQQASDGTEKMNMEMMPGGGMPGSGGTPGGGGAPGGGGRMG